MIDNRYLFTCAKISDLSSVESKLDGKAHYFQDHSGKKKHDFVLVNSSFGFCLTFGKCQNIFFLPYNVGLSYFC